jgi:hypothetical protein
MAAKNRVRDVIGVNFAFRQMFEAGGGEHQRPA